MKRKTVAILWPVVAMAAVFVLGFVLASSRRPDPVQVEVVTRSGPSAAATLSLVLFGVLGLIVLGVASAVAVALVIRSRQQTQRMEQTALLFGVQKPQPTPQRRPQVQSGDGPSIVIVSGGQGTPRVEDFRNGYNG